MSSGFSKHRRRKLITAAWTIVLGLCLLAAQQMGWLKTPVNIAQTNQPGLYAVRHFIDGDTIVVDMNSKDETIRFIGVDTPETHDPRKSVECFGQAAAAFTKQLIDSNRVRLEADPENTNRDRYNRLLRYVYLPDGRLVNALIIQNGYGFAYVGFPFTKLDEFKTYEQQARRENRGLWNSCQPYYDSHGYIHSNPA